MATVTIDHMSDEEAPAAADLIRQGDGVFVHDCTVFQDEHGGWWAYRDGTILFGADRNALLTRIAEYRKLALDLDDLNGRLDRAITRAIEQRELDERIRSASHG